MLLNFWAIQSLKKRNQKYVSRIVNGTVVTSVGLVQSPLSEGHVVVNTTSVSWGKMRVYVWEVAFICMEQDGPIHRSLESVLSETWDSPETPFSISLVIGGTAWSPSCRSVHSIRHRDESGLVRVEKLRVEWRSRVVLCQVVFFEVDCCFGSKPTPFGEEGWVWNFIFWVRTNSVWGGRLVLKFYSLGLVTCVVQTRSLGEEGWFLLLFSL